MTNDEKKEQDSRVQDAGQKAQSGQESTASAIEETQEGKIPKDLESMDREEGHMKRGETGGNFDQLEDN